MFRTATLTTSTIMTTSTPDIVVIVLTASLSTPTLRSVIVVAAALVTSVPVLITVIVAVFIKWFALLASMLSTTATGRP